jgi:inorganic triphosphatase YgiF
MEPLPERITDPAALDRLGLLLPEELEPVFTTRVERRLMLAVQPVPGGPPAIIEVAFDEGAVMGERPERADRRVELELKAGPTQASIFLLGALRAWAPLAIGAADKAERGYRLATRGRAYGRARHAGPGSTPT